METEYRDTILDLRNHPDALTTIVRVIELRKDKLLKTMETSQDKDELWDLKTKLVFLEEFKREIISHSK